MNASCLARPNLTETPGCTDVGQENRGYHLRQFYFHRENTKLTDSVLLIQLLVSLLPLPQRKHLRTIRFIHYHDQTHPTPTGKPNNNTILSCNNQPRIKIVVTPLPCWCTASIPTSAIERGFHNLLRVVITPSTSFPNPGSLVVEYLRSGAVVIRFCIDLKVSLRAPG